VKVVRVASETGMEKSKHPQQRGHTAGISFVVRSERLFPIFRRLYLEAFSAFLTKVFPSQHQ
jgi:hypothetical protein